MKLFLLTALTMTAFASNSLLNRIGVAEYGMHPLDFAVIRVAAGALMLWALVLPRRAAYPPMRTGKRLAGAVALTMYMLGFSWAYISLDAGLGALILFGVLQVVIFGWAVMGGQRVPALRWLGAAIALAGLCVLLWPSGAAAVPLGGAIAMSIAAVGWAAYTLLGRGETDALGVSAGNFLLCLPFVLAGSILSNSHAMTPRGVLVAVVAGAVTSGLGYALWYRVLPGLPSTLAGIAQLSVPVIAVAAGVLLLNEPLTLRLIIASALVLSGIGVSLLARR
ncbi:DMT family transporter [Yoonia sp.]|uniref:DMT family transporter n=1 Tax=Yoonia sp. TaxID=2212373 RepID=UPI003F6D7D03